MELLLLMVVVAVLPLEQMLLLLLLTEIGLATLSTISGGLPTLSCDGSMVLEVLLIVFAGDGVECWKVWFCVM